MSQSSLALSARSYLIAGVSAAVVGAAAVNPVSVPELSPAKIASAFGTAFEMTSVTSSLENAIKNTYDFVEPWVAYGAELTQYVLSFIPGIWWVAPAIDLAYFTIEPLVQAGVFTIADVIGLNFSQIWPDIAAGVTGSINNAVDYALAWLGSLVPLPPFPPFPPGPFASVPAPAAAEPVAGLLAAPSANSITTSIEVGIKNTYNFVQGWTNYAMQWASYALGRIPVVNWFTPVIPLVYNTIEPLVRGGVFSFADLIGLNFAAIGPDIWNGITTSVNNAIQGIINWINAPIPPLPPRPGASVGARTTSVRAAAATPVVVDTKVEAPKVETAEAPKVKAAEAPKVEAAEAPKVEAAEVAEAAEAAEIAETAEVAEVAEIAETVKPTRTARRGHSAPVSTAATDDAGAGSSVKAERPSRTSRAHSNAR